MFHNFDSIKPIKRFDTMKCRRCNQEIGDELWFGWELCDHCGYRFHVETQQSPDDINELPDKKLAVNSK
jgi:hypothetical protein